MRFGKIVRRGVQIEQVSQPSEIFSGSLTSATHLIHKFRCMLTSFNDKICCMQNSEQIIFVIGHAHLAG